MKRVAAILIAFSVTVITVLWLRSLLGISLSFAGDGGPNFGWMFQAMALAAMAFVSALIGLTLLWRLIFLNCETRTRPTDSNDANSD